MMLSTSVMVMNGRISGNESHHHPTDPTMSSSHPMIGTYRLSATENVVNLSIDRTSSGGTLEYYVGGWVGHDGTMAPSSVANNSTPAFLVLRSVRTGLQLSIGHSINPICNHSTAWSAF